MSNNLNIKNMSLTFGMVFTICFSLMSFKPVDPEKPAKPNIIIFYVDDLGYGDLSSYGSESVNTPNVDGLAANGIRFTDAHSTASTCTPSRYSLLTGQHAFRKNASVLPGDAPLLIDEKTPTIASMLSECGYKTGVVGKWHLGLGNGNVNWNQDIKPGPLEVGFDYSFLIPATGDRVPAVYVENHRVINLKEHDDPIVVSYKNKKIGDMPTGYENPELLRYSADSQHNMTIVNGVSRIGYMDGGESALWKDENFPFVMTNKAVEFMDSAKKNPFFLFFSFHDIHVPRLPHEMFKGKTNMGVRGDAIVQMDWMTGKVMEALKERDLLENTLVIFTSDNGPVLNDGYEDSAVEKLGDHDPAGGFRGGKYSIFEAGTRVPTIVYWEGKIQPGVSEALWSQVDLYASIASIIGSDLSKDEAIDSQDISKALLSAQEKGTEYLIEEASVLAIRKGKFKYIEPLSKGQKEPKFIMAKKKIEGGTSHDPQLYDLAKDPGEKRNIAAANPNMVNALQEKLDEIRSKDHRSTSEKELTTN
ncbi:sulfatase-like hydrolase/transferase [Christiangramia crocea]|uniref:Sulfatase-like hydrolase/transferase n=1 Tax=Christiangramia crocea TaxID=2904124 RepID=A0A9X1UYB3_9FLAO|nr:sulfatase-like hydrolase/transferase [Gramella crocea]MCG9972545.1 sulfatase-like hydrolase/transferase [Gramella crocea]